jgi:aminoglycoside 6'-N-acetyltransferase
MRPIAPLPRKAGRTTLRRLRAADLAQFQAYRRDPEVARFQGWEPVEDVQARAFLEAMQGVGLLEPGTWCQLGIALPENDLLVGDIGILVGKDGAQAEIGFSLNRLWQGQGLATEAVGEAVRLVFENTGVSRIIALTDARNGPCIALLGRIGMKMVAEESNIFRGQPCTEYVYSIDRDRPR